MATAIENGRLYRQLHLKADELGRMREFNDNILESLNDGFVAPQSTETKNALAKLQERVPLGATNLQPALKIALDSYEPQESTPAAAAEPRAGGKHASALEILLDGVEARVGRKAE